ncbi:MAG TPA: hypothetical protein VKE92_16445, partial [Anaerolineales bacterium]|nr:hypothetical protein [Anaerolineales bacterium]
MQKLILISVLVWLAVSCSASQGKTTIPPTLTPPPHSTSTFSPMDSATLTPPADSTPMLSPEGTDFTATPTPPRPIATRTAYVTPTPLPPVSAIGTPDFDWEGPAI